MAKKKAKSKSSNKLFPLIMAVLSLAALIMLFLPAVTWGDESFSGMQLAFGYKVTTDVLIGDLTTVYFQFSFLNLLTYLLVIGAIVMSVLALLSKKGNGATFIAIVLAAVAGVFFLLVKNFAVLGEFFNDLYKLGDTTFAKDENAALAVGSIIGAVCMFLTALVGAAKIALKK